MIYARQQAYYEAINASNTAGGSTAFVEFMLEAIKASLIEAIKVSDEMSDEMSDEKMGKAEKRWKLIEAFLQTHEYIMNADVRKLCGVSAATANRILIELRSKNQLDRIYITGHWKYKLSE